MPDQAGQDEPPQGLALLLLLLLLLFRISLKRESPLRTSSEGKVRGHASLVVACLSFFLGDAQRTIPSQRECLKDGLNATVSLSLTVSLKEG